MARRETDKKRLKKSRRSGEVFYRFMRNKTAVIGLVILILIVMVAVCVDLIVDEQVALQQNDAEMKLPPQKGHIFGTDTLGRDYFARVVHGSRMSILVGILTTIGIMTIGCVLGSIAAYYGGIVDTIITRSVDTIMCIPATLLSLTVVAAFGPNFRNLIIAMVVAYVPTTIRFVRGVVLTITEQDYIEAAKAYGATNTRIIFKYILPKAFGPIMVDSTQAVGGVILTASGLSYLGMGVQPPDPEWGALLSSASDQFREAPYLILFPGLAIVLTAFAINLVGDGLRDALDPKLRD